MPPPLTRFVSRVRLRIERRTAAQPCRYYDGPGGPVREIPLLRLVTVARVHPLAGDDPAVVREDALIDTGAWLSAVRLDVWQAYHARGLLDVFPFADGAANGTAHVAGVSTPFKLGRFRLGVLDLLGPRERRPGGPLFHELPPVPVIAQLFLDPRLDSRLLPFPIILGLHAGVLEGRRLRREPVPAAATGLETDAGPAHGQDWFLEAP